jgi:hypothetical protein
MSRRCCILLLLLLLLDMSSRVNLVVYNHVLVPAAAAAADPAAPAAAAAIPQAVPQAPLPCLLREAFLGMRLLVLHLLLVSSASPTATGLALMALGIPSPACLGLVAPGAQQAAFASQVGWPGVNKLVCGILMIWCTV